MTELRTIATSLAIVLAGGLCLAQESATLSAEARGNAIQLDTLSIPTPGEVFAAVNKLERPNWGQLVSTASIPNTSSRAQIALSLGTRVADGFIAVEAQDAQKIKNTGRDIMELAKGLGVSQSILARGNSISDFAENHEWNALKEELEATQNEVKIQMAEQRDTDLVALVSAGAWIRGTNALAGIILANYQEASAEMLRQPAVAELLIAELRALPPRFHEDPSVRDSLAELINIRDLVAANPESAPSQDVVVRISESTKKLLETFNPPVEATPPPTPLP